MEIVLAALRVAVDEQDPDTVRGWLLQLNVLQLLGVISIFGTVLLGIRRVLPHLRRIGNLLDDWFGEEARPGVPRRLGVMERLEQHDAAVAAFTNHTELLSRLEAINMAVHQVGSESQMSSARVESMLERHIAESRMWVAELDARAAQFDFDVPDWPTLDDG